MWRPTCGRSPTRGTERGAGRRRPCRAAARSPRRRRRSLAAARSTWWPPDVPDLLEQARWPHDPPLRRPDGGAAHRRRPRRADRDDLRQRVLSAIAHPQVAYMLLSLGMLGLTIELWTPGAVLPGVVGGVSLLLAFFALQMLPVNFAGAAADAARPGAAACSKSRCTSYRAAGGRRARQPGVRLDDADGLARCRSCR